MKPTAQQTPLSAHPEQPRPTSPSRLDTPDEAAAQGAEGSLQPPKAGSSEALNEERQTPPARTRGVTDV